MAVVSSGCSTGATLPGISLHPDAGEGHTVDAFMQWMRTSSTKAGLVAGADRGHGLIPAYAPAGGVARAARLGGRPHAFVGGRDDRGRVDHIAGRLTVGAGRWVLPWARLVAGSVASLAANVAVAEPSLIGRVIAAWPSFALTASYELLTRQVRRSSADTGSPGRQPQQSRTVPAPPTKPAPAPAAELRLVRPPELGKVNRTPAGADLQWRVPGSGHRLTVPLMAACPAAARSALPTAATSGGDAW
jgi:hypothetical protein